MRHKIRLSGIVRAIEASLVIAFGIILLYLFGMIAINGTFVGIEPNKAILYGEIIMSLLILGFGIRRVWHIKL